MQRVYTRIHTATRVRTRTHADSRIITHGGAIRLARLDPRTLLHHERAVTRDCSTGEALHSRAMGSSYAFEYLQTRSTCCHFALFKAARRGDVRACAKLVASGVDVNMCDPSGWTALHVAAIMGHARVCRTLAGAGARVFAIEDFSTDGVPLLHAAAARGYRAVRRYLAWDCDSGAFMEDMVRTVCGLFSGLGQSSSSSHVDADASTLACRTVRMRLGERLSTLRLTRGTRMHAMCWCHNAVLMYTQLMAYVSCACAGIRE